MKRFAIIFCAFVSVLGIQRAKAWHNFAHGSIAYMAEQHLSPQAKEKCNYYLRHTLSHYASWMDAWRLERFEVVNKNHVSMSMPDGVNLDFKSGDPAGGVMGHLVNALAELGDGKYKNLPEIYEDFVKDMKSGEWVFTGFADYKDRVTGANIDRRPTAEILADLDEVERELQKGGDA